MRNFTTVKRKNKIISLIKLMDQNNNKYNLNFFGNVNAHIFLIKQKVKEFTLTLRIQASFKLHAKL